MKKLFYTLCKGKTVKNGMWLYSLQFFNTIIPLVTIPYITRILGASQYGVFSIQLNIVAYLQVVVEYGFALSATRKVTLMKENNDLSSLFSRVTYSRGGLFLLVFMCTIAYTSISQQTPEENYCLMVLAISLIAYCFQQNWIFQGKQDMRFISITNIIARTVTTVLIFVFVKTSSDLIIYCILYSIAPLIANIIGTMVAIKKYSIKLVMVKIPELWIELKDGFYVFTTQLSSKVFSSIGITFLGFFASESLVGVYSALYKIPYVLLMLWSPISQVMYPIMSRKITEKFSDGIVFIRKIKYITLIIFGMCAFLISLCSRTIVMIFFGKEYMEFWYIVIPLLLWVLIGINNNFLGIQTLVGSGHDKEYGKCFQIGVVSTVCINFLLIWNFSIYGAAFAPLISEIILGTLLRLSIKRIQRKMKSYE